MGLYGRDEVLWAQGRGKNIAYSKYMTEVT